MDLRRPAALLAAVVCLGSLSAGATACGSGGGQLTVTLSSPDAGTASHPYNAADARTYAQYKPGDDATFIVTVVNAGPGSVAGVTVHVVLPTAFRYRATTKLDSSGATRTQPVDAAVNSNTPLFGLWTLAQPGSAGPGTDSRVQITFTAVVGGQPGGAVVQAFAAGDASSGQSNAQPYNVVVNAAPRLSVLVSASPITAPRGTTVTYLVRVTNEGTGNAPDVAVLVTLPPVMTFASSITPFAGNGSRSKGVDPIKNTVEVYYDGFLLPPASNAGPGFEVIAFKADVLGGSPAFGLPTAFAGPSASATPPVAAPSSVPPGTYTVDVSVTDASGDSVVLHAVAPVTVT